MDRLIFDEEHEMFRDSVRSFMINEVQPHGEKWREQGIVDREAYLKAGEQGLLLMWADEKYGGAGVTDFRYEQILMEELTLHGEAGFFLWLHSRLVGPYIDEFGTDEQKDRWLPKCVSGESILAIAMTEPGAGSDLASIRSKAEDKGDHFLLNGAKTYISNGILADLVIVAARTDPENKRGISLFVVERGMDGFERGANLAKIGLKSQDTAELFFNNVKVPKENLLGQLHRGFYHMMHGTACIRPAGCRVPEHALQDGRYAHGNRHSPGVRRPVRPAAQQRQAQCGGCGQGKTVHERARGTRDRRVPATPRRCRLHGRVSDQPHVHGGACVADLRRILGDHARDHRALDRPRSAQGRLMKTAFVGLGVMGYPMAGYLAARGHEVVVYNRNTDKAERWLEQNQGRSAATPADAADGADIVFCCVGNDDDVREVTLGEFGAVHAMPPGSILVDHTTASATLARELHTVASERQVGFLDAPLSGGQAGAENGQLTIMVGGDADVFERALPVMESYAKAVTLIGPAGSGQLAKMVNQICIAGLLQGLSEGLHFATRAGLDIEKVISAISKGAAQSWQMDHRWQTMVNGQFEFGFAVDWMRKDLGIALDEARSNGARLELTELIDRYYAEVQALGGNRWDTSSLITRLEPPPVSRDG